MSNAETQGAQGRQVWMFMAATAMATTVSTLAATAMVQADATEPVAVTCACDTPTPVVVPSSSAPEAEAPAPQPEPVERDHAVTPPMEQGITVAPPPAAKVEGALSKEVIRRIVRAHVNEVRHCYNEGLASDPELAGRVVVQVTIGGADGKVTRSEVESTNLEGEVPECIAKAMERWMFPTPADGKNVTVTYPFVLEPG